MDKYILTIKYLNKHNTYRYKKIKVEANTPGEAMEELLNPKIEIVKIVKNNSINM